MLIMILLAAAAVTDGFICPYLLLAAAQCGNAAYGVCQAKAMDSRQSPCGSKFNGMERCSQKEFIDFYSGEEIMGAAWALQEVQGFNGQGGMG